MICGWSFVPGKPVVRGYDTSALFREDTFHRIQISLCGMESSEGR